jgi:hypothetical protein
MNNLRARLEALQAAFARLTQREQFLVIGTTLLVCVFVMVGIGWLVGDAIGRAEDRVKIKTEALTEILTKEGEYRAREQSQKARLRSLRGQSKVRLVKIVEDAAKASGVAIGQLSPDDGEPSAEGVIKSRVELRASELSIDRLQDFLARLQSAPGVVTVERLKVNKPYRKETLNVDMTVTTYRVEG